MKPIDIVIILLAVAAVVGVIAWTVYRKKKGINSCGCDCSSCGGCASCHRKTDEKTETTENKPE